MVAMHMMSICVFLKKMFIHMYNFSCYMLIIAMTTYLKIVYALIGSGRGGGV